MATRGRLGWLTPDYRAAYERGWRASARFAASATDAGSPLERADDRGEPAAWYDGYHDQAADRPKWHTPTHADQAATGDQAAPASPDVDQAAPVPTCDHVTGQPGCELPGCNGIPSDGVIMESDRVEITPDGPTGYETGTSVFAREMAEAFRTRMRADVSGVSWACSRGLAYGDRSVRRASVITLTVDGRTVRVIGYDSRGQLSPELPYFAVTVDGFLIENGRMIPGARPSAEVIASVVYAVTRHVEMITPDARVTPDMPAHVPDGATLRPVRLADVRPGDVIRSFFDFAGHATVTGHPVASQYGAVELPATRDGRPETIRGDRDKTYCLIIAPDQAAPVELPADAPADQAATGDQAAPVYVDRVAFTVDRGALADALAYLVKGLPSRVALPILSGVMMVADAPDTVRLSVFDFETGRSVELPATDVTTGRGVLPIKQLAGVIKGAGKSVPTARVDLDGMSATITAGAASLTLPTLPAVDYPPLPTLPAPAATVDVSALADAVARVAVAAGTDETLPAMTHVYATVDGGAWQLNATDRYRLAVDAVTWSPVPDAPAGPSAVMLPARQLADAVKAFARYAGKAGGRVTVGYGPTASVSSIGRGRDRRSIDVPGCVALTFGRYTLIMRPYDSPATYPPVRSLFPDTVNASATIGDARGLVDAVKRVARVIPRTENVPVRLTFTADQVTATIGGNPDQEPTASETITSGVAFTGTPGFMIAFNPAYLVDALNACGARVRVDLVDNVRPAVFRDADAPADDTHAHLLMPIRIKSGAATPAAPVAKGDEIMPATDKTPATRTRRTRKAAPAATPAPADQAAPATPDRDTVERIAQAAHDKMTAGDYAGALAAIDQGQSMAPGHLVADRYPWDTVRAAIIRKRDQAAPAAPVELPADAPGLVDGVPVDVPDTYDRRDAIMAERDAAHGTADGPAPAPAATPAPASPAARIVITHGPAGTLLSGFPFRMRFLASRMLNAVRGGLGWTWSRDVIKGGAWVLNDSAGTDPDAVKITAAVDAFAALTPPVVITVDVPGYVRPDQAAPAAPVELPADQAAPADADQAAPADVDQAAPALPDVPPAGTHVEITGADGHGRPRTLAGYVTGTPADAGVRGLRVHLSADPDGKRARVIYVQPGSRVDLVDAPADQAAPVSAPPAPAPADVLTLVETAAAARATLAAETAAPAPAAPMPAVDQVDTSGPLPFTLAPYSDAVGMSYRASRKAARDALTAAGVRYRLDKGEARRAFTVTCDPGDRARVAAIVAGAVALDTDATPATV